MRNHTATADSPHLDVIEALRSLDRLDIRFDDFLRYAETALGHSRATLKWYRCAYQNYRHFLYERGAAFGGDVRSSLLAIEEWVRWNREQKRTPVTLVAYFRGLQAFYRDLELRDGLPSPFQGVRRPAAQKRVPKARTKEECRRILDAARCLSWPSEFERSRAVAILAMMMYAGLRKGEVLRLQVQHVNIAEGTMVIVRGKGRHGGKDRTAYSPPELSLILREYLRQRARLGVEPPEFFCVAAGRGMSESTLLRIVKRVRRASGVPFSMHSLRHSFVTMLLKSGVPLHVASELAGHSDIATTAGYLRVFDDEKRKEATRLRLY